MGRAGNCYEDALLALASGRYDMDGGTTYLCHGFPRLAKPDRGHPAGTMYGHAWLEVDLPLGGGVTLCINLLGEHTLPRDLYYSFGQIDEELVTRYTFAQAMGHAIATGHNGPWVEGPPETVYGHR